MAAVAIVLAAGAGRRFGGAKQLVPWGPRPLVRHVARVALDASVGQVIVVIGAADGPVRRALVGLPLLIVRNPDWRRGVGTSIAAGLGAAPAATPAAVFVLADQPNVSSALVDRCLAVWRISGAPVVMCHDGNSAGPPTVFDARLFDELGRLPAEEGGRAVVRQQRYPVRHVPVAAWEVADMDTPLDYVQLGWQVAVRRLASSVGRQRGKAR